MNKSILKSIPKGTANNWLKILAVVAVIALLMTTQMVSNFISQNIVTSARAEDIQGTAENILYVVSGLILFIIGGFVILPFFKIALMVTGIWLAFKGLNWLYGFFLKRP